MALYRTTSDPNVTCPEDLYSSDELERMDQAADLEEQIDAIDRHCCRRHKRTRCNTTHRRNFQ